MVQIFGFPDSLTSRFLQLLQTLGTPTQIFGDISMSPNVGQPGLLTDIPLHPTLFRNSPSFWLTFPFYLGPRRPRFSLLATPSPRVGERSGSQRQWFPSLPARRQPGPEARTAAGSLSPAPPSSHPVPRDWKLTREGDVGM